MRYLIILFIIIIVTFYFLQSKNVSIFPIPQPSPSGSSKQVLGKHTKSTGCIAQNGLQDSACTPGDIFPNSTKDQICTPGYSKSVRNVPQSIKDQVYAEYGIVSHKPGQYEVDHHISLELGGSNDISNLWPEAAEPRPGFHEKDQVENYLHQQVCSGRISLQEAQIEIAHNWLEIYKKIPNPAKYDFNAQKNSLTK